MFPGLTEGSSAVATAQAQSHQTNSPFGKFGASGNTHQVLSALKHLYLPLVFSTIFFTDASFKSSLISSL